MAYLPVSEEPLVYILGPDSMLFDFRGAYTLIDSGDSAVSLTKHIRQVNCLLTPAPSDKAIQNALFQNKNRLVPVVGSVIGKELNHRLTEQGIPATVAKQSDKYEPITLYKSLAEGRLELFVLDGGQKPSLDALQKALDKGDSASLEGAAEKFGMIFALVWYPAKLNEKVKRILYTGNASTERVVLALEKASSLTLLQTPSATTGQANAGIAPPPKNKVTSARPNGAAPTRTAPARPAPTTRAAAPAKPATARGPAKEVLKPPPTSTTARPARPSTTSSTVVAARSAKPAAPAARSTAAPARRVPEPAAVKKTAAPLRGAVASKPAAPSAAAKKPEPKKVDQKAPAPTKPKETPKEAPKAVPKPAEHVPPVVPPQPETPLVTIADEPSRPTDQSSSVPIVPDPGNHELAPEVRVIPATPEPPHRDDDDHKPEVPEHVAHPAPEEPEPDHHKDKPAEPTPAEPTPTEPAPGFNEPHVPQPADKNGLLDDVEEPMVIRRISMDTDLTDEAQKFAEEFEQKAKLEENGNNIDQSKSALDELLSGIPLDSNQLVDAAIAASLSQTLSGEPNEFYHQQHPDTQKQDPITNGGHQEEEAEGKMRAMQTRSSVVEAGDDNKVYEEPDKALDDILSHVTSQSEEVDRRQSQDNEGFKPVDFNELPPQPMNMVLNKIKPSLKNDRYFELVTVPHKAGKCTLENLDEARDFFRTIRSTVYVLASEDIQQFVLDGWLEGKKAWQKSDAPSSLYPSVSTPAIQAFTTAHRSDLEQEHMAIHPSIANTNLLIQADDGPEEFKTAKLLL